MPRKLLKYRINIHLQKTSTIWKPSVYIVSTQMRGVPLWYGIGRQNQIYFFSLSPSQDPEWSVKSTNKPRARYFRKSGSSFPIEHRLSRTKISPKLGFHSSISDKSGLSRAISIINPELPYSTKSVHLWAALKIILVGFRIYNGWLVALSSTFVRCLSILAIRTLDGCLRVHQMDLGVTRFWANLLADW
jgi:hypothetical protein